MSHFFRKNKLTRKISSDSLTSLIFPWHSRPVLLGTNIQTGRTVGATEFYLFYISNMLLILAMGMLGIGLWSIFIKIPYTYLVNCSLEIGFFTIPSAILCLPSFWIILAVHNDEKSRKFLTLALLLLIFAITLVATGMYTSMTHKFRTQPNYYLNEFNQSMHESIKWYKTRQHYQNAWDFIQSDLKCCGIDGVDDWFKVVDDLPQSCYERNDTLNGLTPRAQGCLKFVASYLESINFMLNGFFCSVLVLQCLIFMALSGICLKRQINKT